MPKLTKTCPQCHKIADESSHQLLSDFGLRVVNLTCGHSYTEKIVSKADWENLTTTPGMGRVDKLFPYQGAGYEFARESSFRALIADEPGLGKTAQTLVCLRLHPEELLPCLVIVKSALKLQYMKQIIRWCGPEFQPQIISDSKDPLFPMFDVVITTYDLLWRINKKEIERVEKEEKAVRDRLKLYEWDVIPEEERAKIKPLSNPFKEFNFKCAILDECQQIKNPTSKRANQVKAVCENIPHILASSGTPIKNNAGEYFTILNILRPEKFHDYKQYLTNYCDYYWNGRNYKIGGIKDIDWFRSQTSDFIIRRTEKDVEFQLPEIRRNFTECDFASEKMKRQYEDLAEDFSDYYYKEQNSQDFMQNILAKMAKLRHAAGINKVLFTADYITDFLLDTPRERKLVVFVHHLDVAEMLKLSVIKKLKEEEELDLSEPLMFFGQDMNKREENLFKFMNEDKCRVMIASTLSMGEGVDGLQNVCHDCILLERQWNPANEEQVERRFKRIGASKGTVNANYILSTGTIDEYFTELVEQKRQVMSQTLDGNENYVWQESSLVKELADILAKKGSKKWKL